MDVVFRVSRLINILSHINDLCKIYTILDVKYDAISYKDCCLSDCRPSVSCQVPLFGSGDEKSSTARPCFPQFLISTVVFFRVKLILLLKGLVFGVRAVDIRRYSSEQVSKEMINFM
jgi:hypothetical protein